MSKVLPKRSKEQLSLLMTILDLESAGYISEFFEIHFYIALRCMRTLTFSCRFSKGHLFGLLIVFLNNKN